MTLSPRHSPMAMALAGDEICLGCSATTTPLRACSTTAHASTCQREAVATPTEATKPWPTANWNAPNALMKLYVDTALSIVKSGASAAILTCPVPALGDVHAQFGKKKLLRKKNDSCPS